jgi:hypothetical protein
MMFGPRKLVLLLLLCWAVTGEASVLIGLRYGAGNGVWVLACSTHAWWELVLARMQYGGT